MSGLTVRRSSYPSPSRSSVPTLKFSVTTSERFTSSLKSSTPFGVFSSSVIASLFRSRYCAAGTRSSTPLRLRLMPSDTRSRPRSRDSTLITRAPRSASSIVQKGMAMTCPRSSTVMSLSACSTVYGLAGPRSRGDGGSAIAPRHLRAHQGDQPAAVLHRVVQGIEAADEQRRGASVVVVEQRLGDLLGVPTSAVVLPAPPIAAAIG